MVKNRRQKYQSYKGKQSQVAPIIIPKPLHIAAVLDIFSWIFSFGALL